MASDAAIVEGDEWVEGEADLTSGKLFPFPYVERWALFRSGQFVHDFALSEDFLGTESWPVVPQYFAPGQGKTYLNILRTVKIISCLYEFAARMTSRQLLDPRAAISIELHGMAGRELSYMFPKYILDERYWCRKESIHIERTVSSEELVIEARELALDAIIEIFGNFRWLNPPRTLFAEEQARILA